MSDKNDPYLVLGKVAVNSSLMNTTVKFPACPTWISDIIITSNQSAAIAVKYSDSFVSLFEFMHSSNITLGSETQIPTNSSF